jgi:serine/threonine-protein kinase GIN4
MFPLLTETRLTHNVIPGVVEDARQNFASTSTHALPALPVAPASRQLSLSRSQTRSNRSSRLPRKLLAANQIFVDGYEDGSFNASFLSSASPLSSELPSPEPSAVLEESSVQFASVTEASSPRPRRYTIVTRSPKPSGASPPVENGFESPSKRKDRWRSQGDLLQRSIAPIERLTLELERGEISRALL